MNSRFSLCLTAALLLFAASAVRAQRAVFLVELADGARVEATVRQLSAEGWVLDTSDGVRTLGPEELRLLTRTAPQLAAPAPSDLVVLAADEGQLGSRLWGSLSGGDDSGLTLVLASGDELSIPFDEVDRVLPRVSRPLDRLLSLKDGGFDDRVWRLADDGRLDALSGVLARVDAVGLTVESSLGELSLPYEELLAVVLAATEAPDPAPLAEAPLRGRLRLRDGSLFEVGVLDGDRDGLHVLTAFAGPLSLPWELIDQLLLPDPALAGALLSQAKPVEVEESSPSAPGEEVLFPWQRDLSVGGGPLGLVGVRRAAGLGVHANSRLVFLVPDGARSFRVSVGVADEALKLRAEPSMEFRVEIDDRFVESGVMGGDEGERVLRLGDFEGAARLTLICSDAGDLDAGDRGVFSAPMFSSTP